MLFEVPRVRDLLLVSTFFSVPALTRIALMVDKRVAPSVADLHGFLVDLFVALVIAVAVAPLLRKTRWALLVLVPWSLAHHASYEFTKTLNTLPPWQSIGYLGDRTFVESSVAVLSSPIFFVGLLGTPAALSVGAVRRRATRWPAELAALALGVGLIVFVWPFDRDHLEWRQTNFLASNAENLVRSGHDRDLPPLAPARAEELDRLFRADVSGGVPLIPAAARPNVLLVLLEGISGTDLPSVAEHHGHGGAAMMPELDELGRRNVLYRNFITHQRGTNRGLYSSLCGSYDKLSATTAKMTELAAGPNVECLPAVLQRNGYRTTFLQAAPLGFMLKDSFMPRIGFGQTLGAERFSTSYARSNWGVDDRAFFEGARKFIADLRRDSRPWMTTLLTVGTHHPFPVPESFASPEPHGSYGRAARYADKSVVEFVRGLEADGVLDDTIVLITSDESHGLEDGDDRTRLLAQNLSFLVGLFPAGHQKTIDELFSQSDTVLTILDALGLATDSLPFIGRSALRSYAEPRRIFVANQNARSVGMIHSQQRNAWSCDEDFHHCDHLQFDRSFLSPHRTVTDAAVEEMAFLKAAQTRAAGRATIPYGELLLSSDHLSPLGEEETLLYAGQYLDLPAGTLLEVDLEIQSVGQGTASFHTDVVADGGATTLAEPELLTLAAGETAVVRYAYRLDKAQHWVEARAFASRTSEWVALRFTRAVLRVSKANEEPPGLDVRERIIRKG